jgi:hypothetical protein
MDMSASAQNKESLEPYASAVGKSIRVAMVKHNVRYEDLVERLEAKGISYSSSNLRNKVSQNMLPAALYLAIMQCITEQNELIVELPENSK